MWQREKSMRWRLRQWNSRKDRPSLLMPPAKSRLSVGERRGFGTLQVEGAEFLQTAERETGREGSAAGNAHGVVAESKSVEFGTVARLERFTEETHVTVGDATVWE